MTDRQWRYRIVVDFSNGTSTVVGWSNSPGTAEIVIERSRQRFSKLVEFMPVFWSLKRPTGYRVIDNARPIPEVAVR